MLAEKDGLRRNRNLKEETEGLIKDVLHTIKNEEERAPKVSEHERAKIVNERERDDRNKIEHTEASMKNKVTDINTRRNIRMERESGD